MVSFISFYNTIKTSLGSRDTIQLMIDRRRKVKRKFFIFLFRKKVLQKISD